MKQNETLLNEIMYYCRANNIYTGFGQEFYKIIIRTNKNNEPITDWETQLLKYVKRQIGYIDRAKGYNIYPPKTEKEKIDKYDKEGIDEDEDDIFYREEGADNFEVFIRSRK